MVKNKNIVNPLLEKSKAPFGAPMFSLIEKKHYLPAFEEAIRLAKAEIDTIVDNPEPPSFSNTIEALEYAGRKLAGVEGVFFNLLEADSDNLMHEIAESVSPMLTDYQMYISLNKKLFDRIKQVYLEKPALKKEEEKLLKDTYKSFTRNGAALSDEEKKLYGQWCEALALWELKFGKNLLAATNSFALHITDEKGLEGLPDYVREAGAQAAAERGEDGWIFTLHQPSYSPFMKYSSMREARKKMYMAFSSRALGGENDNTLIIKHIIELRMKIAGILGYETFADYAIEDRMAAQKDKVLEFLEKLMRPSFSCARKELSGLLAFAKERGFEGEEIMPWDLSYWAEKYQQWRFSIDEETLKPYFRLESCINAVFNLAERLYGIRFFRRNDISVYHEEVEVYEVRDEKGEHIALFYADFFPRESKRGGAWMTEFRGQYILGEEEFRPFISIVTNFSKPTSKRPSLLTHNELITFLHEFGHSLHGMLSKGRYPSLSGTSVARDFVELPSQLMENWAYEPAFLNTFAKHYKTGENIPEELINKIVESRNYLSGYQQVRQLQFGIIDMAWHTLKEFPQLSVMGFEKEVLKPYATLPFVEGTGVSPAFGHIFSGGYSAGYYSYKWAEVLEADAFALFKEKGVFNKEVAESFRKNILERGSSEDEASLYRNFRGHDPEPEFLLRKLGIS